MKHALFAMTLVVAVLVACNSVESNCSSFCDRWRECIDSNTNVDSCEKACTNWAEGNSDRETKVDKCDECLTQNDACSDTRNRCTADCFGIPVR